MPRNSRNSIAAWLCAVGWAVLWVGLAVGLGGVASAAITPTGNVEPNISAWDTNTEGFIGRTSAGSAVVNGGSTLTSAEVTLGYDSGVVGAMTVSGPATQWNNRVRIYVGRSGAGALTVENGGVVNNEYTYLGTLTGATGSITVTGAGSTFLSSGSIYVGELGSGQVIVANGGVISTAHLRAAVTSLAGNGTITATKGAILDGNLAFNGPGVTQALVPFGSGGLLTVQTNIGGVFGAGYRGQGSLSITGGASISSNNVVLGDQAGANGTAAVSGAGSKLTLSGGLIVGSAGSGALSLDNLGLVQSAYAYVGGSAGAMGSVSVTGSGTRWTDSLGITVGTSGTGTISVAAAGKLETKNVTLGSSLTGSGTVTVSGAGTQWLNSSVIDVGKEGEGEVQITSGAYVASPEGVFGRLADSTGTGTVSDAGSGWSFSDSLTIGDAGAGSLVIENGGQVTALAAFDIGRSMGGTGVITVRGAGSTLDNRDDLQLGVMQFGVAGYGSLTVSQGGLAKTDEAKIHNGRIVVTGAGSTFTATDLSMPKDSSGRASTREFVVAGGGSVMSSNAIFHGGVVQVTGAGSALTLTSFLDVGGFAPTTLTIDAGGGVSVTGSTSLSAGGAIQVRGAGSKLTTTGEIFVDGGSLTVETGGVVEAGTLYGSLDKLHGNGTVLANGAVLDGDMLFDGPGGSPVIGFGAGGTLQLGGGSLGVGYHGEGSLTIRNGAQISSGDGLVGTFGAKARVRIEGVGSKWTVLSLDVGAISGGDASLVVANGGQLTSYGALVGAGSPTKSRVEVVGAGSQWSADSIRVGESGSGSLHVAQGGTITAYSILTSLGDLSGDGVITTTHGAALDVPVRFDATHGTQQSFAFGNGGVLHVNWHQGLVGVGWKGRGKLIVAEGFQLTSSQILIAAGQGSTGQAIVSGPGSMWSNVGPGLVYIGQRGPGSLVVEKGGRLSTGMALLGGPSTTRGQVVITDAGSRWDMTQLSVFANSGLHIRNGGVFAANRLILGNTAAIASIDVGRGSSLSLSGASNLLSNGATIRAIAAPEAAAGLTATPLVAPNRSGGGKYQALGGAWNLTTGEFTVSSEAQGVSATPLAMNLGSQQRARIVHGSSGSVLAASLLSKSSGSFPVSFTATALASPPPLGGVLSAWQVAITGSGYVANDPLALSFSVNSSVVREDVYVWKLTGATWSLLDTPDLSCVAGFATFVTTQPGSYALLSAPARGDFDRDGRVTGDDLLAWQRGESPQPNSASDLAAWRANFGSPPGAAPTSAAVPEPATGVMNWAAAIVLSGLQRRKRRE